MVLGTTKRVRARLVPCALAIGVAAPALSMLVASGCGARTVEPTPAGAFEISNAESEPTVGRADEECGALVSSTPAQLADIVRAAQPERLRQAALDVDHAGDLVMEDHGWRGWAKEYATLSHAQAFVMRRIADSAAASDAAGRASGATLFESLAAEKLRLEGRIAESCASDVAPTEPVAPPAGLFLECPFPTECGRFDVLLSAWLSDAQSKRSDPTSADASAFFDRMAARLAHGRVESARMEGRRRAVVELVERIAVATPDAATTANADLSLLYEYRDALSQDCRGDLSPEIEAADRALCSEGDVDACTRVVSHAMSHQLNDRLELAERYCVQGAKCACSAATRIRMIDQDNPAAAFVALEAHCAEGHAPECFLLAHHLTTGKGVTADLTRAQTLFVRACGDVGGELSCASVAPPFAPGSPAEQAMNRACDEFGTHSACTALGREPRASQ
jgi:TPR repeat protein